MAGFVRVTILLAFILYAGSASAAGTNCPSGANYSGTTAFSVNATLGSLGITSCYFVAANGSDSNNGTSESTPWAHLPGMSGAAGNAAAHTPVAGEGYILRGGDTWNNPSVNWSWSGASGSPIYVGVDKTWYSGSSWSRPIWTCKNGCWSTGTGNKYDILDNIEMTGLVDVCTNCGVSGSESGSSPNFVNMYGTYQLVENLYIHGWSTTRKVSNSGSQAIRFTAGSNATGDTMRYNIIDGSDTAKNMLFVTFGNTPIAYGNYMAYVYTGLDGCGDDWHDNILDNTMVQGVVTGHQDGLYHVTQCYSPNSFIYNNVIRNTTNSLTGGAVKLWLNGNAPCPFSSCTSYAFNNIIYNNYPGNTVDTGGHLVGVNYGTWYFFNNTVQCGMDSAMGICAVGMNTGATLNFHSSNNHWIQSGTASPLSCSKNPGGSCSQTDDLMQTLAQANSQGYTGASTYAFMPTNSSGSTLTAAATSMSSICSTISALNSVAGAACQSDTTYACNYVAANHSLSCPKRVTVARTSEPSIGAYQFGSAQSSTPDPPMGLTVSVQ